MLYYTYHKKRSKRLYAEIMSYKIDLGCHNGWNGGFVVYTMAGLGVATAENCAVAQWILLVWRVLLIINELGGKCCLWVAQNCANVTKKCAGVGVCIGCGDSVFGHRVGVCIKVRMRWGGRQNVFL